ncbi:MAG: nitrogen fixation protein NifQ, partial [Aquabacterium sp.]|nr:nitrogen fixation protein NifQ [Aquabacterium sp.]
HAPRAHAGRRAQDDARWAAHAVATASLGDDHLWQDLGLPSRAVLGELMQRCFPTLAARNTRDMKWKKFLYKQLCEREGLFICKAPSCQACSDQPLCFGPEA